MLTSFKFTWEAVLLNSDKSFLLITFLVCALQFRALVSVSVS